MFIETGDEGVGEAVGVTATETGPSSGDVMPFFQFDNIRRGEKKNPSRIKDGESGEGGFF